MPFEDAYAAYVAGKCSGIGIALMARFLGDAAPGLVELPCQNPPPTREIWLGVHQDMRTMPRIRAGVEAITAVLGEVVEG